MVTFFLLQTHADFNPILDLQVDFEVAVILKDSLPLLWGEPAIKNKKPPKTVSKLIF